jgi:negative regulator of sigma E activity
MNEAIKMQISAFVDGELPDSEADLLLRRLSQDAALRREAADYLEFGRIMRGETSVRGVEQLRERIAAAIDDKIVEEDQVGPESESGRAVRPLLGVAVAASVALVAIFGLQLTPGTDTPSPAANAVAGSTEDSGYSTPKPLDQQILQYVERHGAASSEAGANGMRARLTALRRSEEMLVDDQVDDETDSEESPVEESQTRP